MDRKKKKFTPVITVNECKGCERCVYSCPKKVLRLENKLNSYGYRYAFYIGEGCIGCGSCFYTCPEPGAVSIYEETEDNT
ncbi:MAG TPA: ketoisovalerate oxidoreductase [Lentisphaeria bacterium]|nr:MAG: ketoisovalerate oxidoreductase [Lentisphaerae bacterium GWF2_49_21]HBC86180.1 ketoisovalerate oxidoreductase [Lentisphaeria bacterium]